MDIISVYPLLHLDFYGFKQSVEPRHQSNKTAEQFNGVCSMHGLDNDRMVDSVLFGVESGSIGNQKYSTVYALEEVIELPN